MNACTSDLSAIVGQRVAEAQSGNTSNLWTCRQLVVHYYGTIVIIIFIRTKGQ